MFHWVPYKLVAFTLWMAACCVVVPSATYAQERRIALVIGNGDYQQLSPLENPVRDAEAIGQSLSALGFTVFLATNLDLVQFQNAIIFFLSRAENADTTLIYFAGHGATLAGQSYLFPTDFGKDGIYNMHEAIALDALVDAVGSDLTTNLVFVDACRDNPLQSGTATPNNLIAAPQSLRSRPRTGTLISFATTPGQVAYDGTGLHSPFTGALLDHLASQNLDIELMLKRVRRDVVVNSNGQQVPWSESSLLTDYYLAPGGRAETASGLNPRHQPPNQSLLSALSDTGFSRKPILQKFSSGLTSQTERQLQARAAAPDSETRSKRIRALLCSAIAAPVPEYCLDTN